MRGLRAIRGVYMKEETIERIRKFTEDRDWDQFHTPANLAKMTANLPS